MTELIGQIPCCVYLVLICLILGGVMKKFLPTDNRLIPAVLILLTTVLCPAIEGLEWTNVVNGIFSGAAATGLHQVWKQRAEGKDLAAINGDGSLAEDLDSEVVQDDTDSGAEGFMIPDEEGGEADEYSEHA